MYRHNPLPQGVSKPKIRRNIVFSSPKFDKFHQTIKQKKLPKSEPRLKSIHRINSKQKPKIIFSPCRKTRNFQISTEAGNQSQKLPFSRDNKPESFNQSRLISVSDLLEKRNLGSEGVQSFLIHEQKIPQVPESFKITKIVNPQVVKLNKNMNSIKQRQRYFQQMNVYLIIENNYWSVYEGQICLSTNKFEGYGSLKLLNGEQFVGFFRHGYPQGHGTYYRNSQFKHSQNNQVNGIWHKGSLVQIF